MKKNNHDITPHLTQTELLDYTNGVLGNEEMYRLELHINECELCNDALEGIALVKNNQKILDALSTKIVPAHQKGKGINYMIVAASIALIAVSSFSYWLLTKPNADTLALNETADPFEEQPTETIKEEAPSPAPIEIIEEPITAEKEISMPINERKKTEITSDPTTATPPKMEASKQKMTIRSKEIEAVDEPTPITTVAEQEIKENKQEIIVEEGIYKPTDAEADISLSEVVTESVTRKSKRSKKTSAKNASTLVDQKEPIPIGGISALKTYTDSNLRYPQKARDNNVKGTVVLNVSINSDGSINAITVVKGLGFGCDAEAMRLIANGPKWTPKVENGKAVKASRQVKIKFKK